VALGITAVLSFALLSSERTGTGAEVAEVVPGQRRRLGTVLCCYAMWGAGMPLALTVIVVYYQRLVVHKLPAREIIVSLFLPLGPLGFGGYG